MKTAIDDYLDQLGEPYATRQRQHNRRYRMWRLYYDAGLTLRQIGHYFGISGESVRKQIIRCERDLGRTSPYQHWYNATLIEVNHIGYWLYYRHSGRNRYIPRFPFPKFTIEEQDG